MQVALSQSINARAYNTIYPWQNRRSRTASVLLRMHRRNCIMCTCYQNATGFGCRNRCGCCGNGYNASCANGYNSSCGSGLNSGCGSVWGGCARNSLCGSVATVSGNAVSTSNCGRMSTQCCNRYVSFPVSGTAYVPTSAIQFCPNALGVGNAGANAQTNTGGGSACGCFGRCGGATAFSNFNQDYYARQYGLDD